MTHEDWLKYSGVYKSGKDVDCSNIEEKKV